MAQWLSGWKYRKKHTLGGIAGAGTNYPVKLQLHHGKVFKEYQAFTDVVQGIPDFGNTILYNGKFYFGLQQKNGTALYVAEWDIATGAFVKYTLPYVAPNANGHHRPTLLHASDGYWYAFAGYWGGGIQSMRSTNINDISAWETEVEVSSHGSYPKGYENVSTNRIYVMYRRADGTQDTKYRYAFSDDDGASWDANNNTVWPSGDGSVTGYYLHYKWDSTNSIMHVSATGARVGGVVEKRDSVYYGYTDDYGATWKDIDGVTQTDVADLKIWDGFASRTTINLDSDGYPIIASGVRYDTGEAYPWTTSLNLHRWNGSSWSFTSISSTDIHPWFPMEGIQQVGDTIYITAFQIFSDGHVQPVIWWSKSPYTSWNSRLSERNTDNGYGIGRSGDTIYLFYTLIGGELPWDKTTVARFPGDTEEIVGLNGQCKADFSDVRITSSDGETLYDFWIPSVHVDNSERAVIWFKVTEDLGTDKEIYIYYGNLDASYTESTSDGEDVFTFFDGAGFGGAVDWATKWESTDQSYYSIESGELRLDTPDVTTKVINPQPQFTGGYAFESYIRNTNDGAWLILSHALSKGVYVNFDSAQLYWANNNMTLRLDNNSSPQNYNPTDPVRTNEYFVMRMNIPTLGVGGYTEIRRRKDWLIHSYSDDTYYQTAYGLLFQWVLDYSLVNYYFVRSYVLTEGVNQINLHGAWEDEEIFGNYWIGVHQVAARHQEPADEQLAVSHKITWGN